MSTLKIIAAIAVSVSASVSCFAEALPTDIADISAQSGIADFPMGEADIIAQSVIPEPNTDFTGIPDLQGLEESEGLFLDNLAGGGNNSLLKPKSSSNAR